MTRDPMAAYSGPPLTPEARHKLVEDYLPLVHHVLGRLPIHLPSTLDREDLVEVGVLGLINAADSYNPGRGAAFKTFAFVNIRGAILDEIRKHDPIPRSRRDRVREVQQAEARLSDVLDRAPTPEEIATEAGLTVEQVEDTLVHAHGAIVLSLEEPQGGDDAGPARLMDCLRLSSSPDPSEEAEARELRGRLADAILQLPDRERHVIVLYYAEDLRLKDIGAILGVTESRVCQLHARALLRLSQHVRGKQEAARP